MTTVFADLTMTINGFIAGLDVSPEAPLGVGGGKIHTWAYELEAWRERLGLKGGVTNPDAEIMEETFARVGANIMGRQLNGAGST